MNSINASAAAGGAAAGGFPSAGAAAAGTDAAGGSPSASAAAAGDDGAAASAPDRRPQIALRTMRIAHATDHCMQMVKDLLELCMALQMHGQRRRAMYGLRPFDVPDSP